MRLLHTSDWHLGRTLYGRKRHEEFQAFLDWLADTLRERAVDVLLVAGDIFDTGTPGNRDQALYYRFLHRVAESNCRHVVIIGGNHDSPSFLEAPRALLRVLNVHVIGAVTGNIEDEVLVLEDACGEPELIVCAVPYLRDRDVRTVEAGEGLDDKARGLAEGIRTHYAQVCALAEQRREVLGRGIPDRVPGADTPLDNPQQTSQPIEERNRRTLACAAPPFVAMGHLFTAGGRTMEGDGVRELYIGSLAHVPAGIFPACIDYLALGHLHVPQRVGGSETRRYSGSPLPMGFGEAGQEKTVCLVDFGGGAPSVSPIPVPVFQRLAQIRGDMDKILDGIARLQAGVESVWLEIVYEGEAIAADLREHLEEAVAGTELEILRVRNNRLVERALHGTREGETLADLDPDDVFARCLDAHEIPPGQRKELTETYREALQGMEAKAGTKTGYHPPT